MDSDDFGPVIEKYHVSECNSCGNTFDMRWDVCPSCGNNDMNYERKRVKMISGSARRYQKVVKNARTREKALDYDAAIQIWERLGEIKEAARVRRLKTRQKSVRIAQKIVKGNEINRTEIKDSVLNRSNVGSGGDDKLTKIKELKELLDSGAINKGDYEKMKREIIGK